MSLSNPGITLHNITLHTLGDGRGITIGTTALTINFGDITNPGAFGTLGVYLGSGSWQVQSPPPIPGGANPCIADAMYFDVNTPVLNAITALYSSLGLDPNVSYAFNATWASGQSGVVRFGYGNAAQYGVPNSVFIVPVDTTFTDWQTTDPFSVPSVVGTYTLPVVLRPHTPTTPLAGNNWC